jgi:ABC-type uncharacterized transport system permease subunit
VRVILSTGFLPSLSPWSAVPAVVALLAYLLAAGGASLWPRRALPLAWVAHGTAILAHLIGVGEPGSGARFGFAPALSASAWLVVAVYAIESRFVPLTGARRGLAVLGSVTVLLALIFPGEGTVHPVSPWAPLHWILGIASYGLFGAAVLHAVLLDRAERAMRGGSGGARLPGLHAAGIPLLRLETLTFRFVTAGFVMLSLAILLGAWFAAPWRWDHKSVFSVLGWVVFAALLLGRQVFGWRGRRATRWLYTGAGLLLLAYAGSRFVFEVLLHRTPVGGAG